MQVNRINFQQPNFKGYVGSSMKKYVSTQMERELKDLYTKDMKFGPFANMPLLVVRVKTLHAQVQSKLNNFMKTLKPDISMEYEAGVVKLKNNNSQKTLSFIEKDFKNAVTGEIYGDNIDLFSPRYIPNSGERTLYYIDSFASILKTTVGDKIGKIDKFLEK